MLAGGWLGVMEIHGTGGWVEEPTGGMGSGEMEKERMEVEDKGEEKIEQIGGRSLGIMCKFRIISTPFNFKPFEPLGYADWKSRILCNGLLTMT